MRAPKLCAVMLLAWSAAASSVTTANYDISRTGSNTAETILTQSTVSTVGAPGSVRFGIVGTCTGDGFVFTQPLVIDKADSGLATSILLFATMHNSVYACDADDPKTVLWHVNFGTPSTAIYGGLVTNEIGCLSTPVVDISTNVVYASCFLNSGGWTLFALNLADGTTYHSSVAFSGTSGGVAFSSPLHANRSGLALANGKIYTSFASRGDDAQGFRGWVFANDKTTLAQTSYWASTNTNTTGLGFPGGGVWMAGGAPAIDASGNLCVLTGNGDWDGTANYSDSFVKLSPTLSVLDYMTPANQAVLSAADEDIASSRCIEYGSYFMGGGKDQRWWVLNQSAMGNLQGGGGNPPIAQVFGTALSFRSGVSIANNTLFMSAIGGKISAFSWGGSTFTTTPSVQSSATFNNYPPPSLAYSSNAAVSGSDILWAVTFDGNGGTSISTGVLRAFNASTLAQIYSSASRSADVLGDAAKFASPTVVNGKVYVPTFDNSVKVYGLIPVTTVQARGKDSARGNVTFH